MKKVFMVFLLGRGNLYTATALEDPPPVFEVPYFAPVTQPYLADTIGEATLEPTRVRFKLLALDSVRRVAVYGEAEVK